jgi:hypothetical protein
MWGATYQEKRLLNAALGSLADDRFPGAAPARAVTRLERLGFRAVRRTDVDLSNHFRSVDDYIAYRRGFGIPATWSRARADRPRGSAPG